FAVERQRRRLSDDKYVIHITYLYCE
ncbi:hypothetical protein AZ030_004546, partial [Escherichia coli]